MLVTHFLTDVGDALFLVHAKCMFHRRGQRFWTNAAEVNRCVPCSSHTMPVCFSLPSCPPPFCSVPPALLPSCPLPPCLPAPLTPCLRAPLSPCSPALWLRDDLVCPDSFWKHSSVAPCITCSTMLSLSLYIYIYIYIYIIHGIPSATHSLCTVY